jgi:hypothetical protein
MKKRKRGNILTENIIFIILNLVFLSMLIIFLISRTGDAAGMEERYAKQIALILDSAKPGMQINLDMEDAIEKARDKLGEEATEDIVTIDGNIVNVKVHEGGGYSYSFFNDVAVSDPYPNDKGQYIFFITDYNQKEVSENEEEGSG